MGRLHHSEHQSEDYAVLSTALMVGSALRKDTAILLPTAQVGSQVSAERSCHSLLKELKKFLGHHLTSICTQEKHGTVLPRTGGDLMHALLSAYQNQTPNMTQLIHLHLKNSKLMYLYYRR